MTIMEAQRSLMVTTLDPWQALPRVHQLAVAQAEGPAYRFEVRERRDEFAIIQLGLAGRGRVWLADGREVLVVPGEVMCVHTRRDAVRYGLLAGDRPWRFAYAELAGPAALAAVDELTARHGHVLVPADRRGLERLLTNFADRAGTHRAWWDSAASARTATAILTALMPRPGGEQQALAERALAFLDAHLGERISVAEAAAELGVGREHLTRRLRALVGEAPASWLRRRRMERARELLAAPDARVATVAAAVGYRSLAQFARAYRDCFGCPPSTRL